jgi:GDSL-like lipase/acylhydrolase family protein/SGNH-like hydrolase/esterase family protein
MAIKKNFLKIICTAILFLSIHKLSAQTAVVYHDASKFLFVGQGFKEAPVYQRLPLRYKGLVRPELWQISLCPTGMAICFQSNSPRIAVKWKTGNDEHYPHVAESLVKGVDLYARDNGKWYYAGLGNPRQKVYNEAVLIRGMDTTMKTFMLNLPMYETVDSVYIGVIEGSQIEKPVQQIFSKTKPIVFYGTSIVQGASAMRPGMAYPSIIERQLNIETINLGFSGNGRLEEEIGKAMAEINASCYVIDCGPNLTPELAKQRTVPFIKFLHKSRPEIPILFVENINYPQGRFDMNTRQAIDSINLVFKEAYTALRKEGFKNLYYLPAKNLIGDDGEATVDGTHLTDVGFMRIATEIEKQLKLILHLK